FLKLNLESPKVRNQISSKAGGSTRFNVSQSILSSIEIRIPDQSEQEKIAEFMSHIDKKIQLQKEKVKLLSEKKKGFLQRIFNQEFNFKDGNIKDYPNWKSVKLKELIKQSNERNKDQEINLVLSVNNKKGFIAQSEQFDEHIVASAN